MVRRLLIILQGIFGPSNVVRQIEWRRILALLVPSNGETVLDAACGSGLLTARIARTGSRVWGVDIAPNSLRAATFTAHALQVVCGFSVQDVTRLAFPDCTFDKLVSSSALEHFGHDELALREMARVLKPGGLLVLTCDSLLLPMKGGLRELHRQRAEVIHYYTKQEIVAKLERTGFRVVHAEYILKTHLTNAFYQIGIQLSWRGLLWVGVSLIATPLCLLIERIPSRKDGGQTVIVHAERRCDAALAPRR